MLMTSHSSQPISELLSLHWIATTLVAGEMSDAGSGLAERGEGGCSWNWCEQFVSVYLAHRSGNSYQLSAGQ